MFGCLILASHGLAADTVVAKSWTALICVYIHMYIHVHMYNKGISPTQILCSAGDITPIRNGKVPLHPAHGGAAADEHAEHGEGVCHCSPPWT